MNSNRRYAIAGLAVGAAAVTGWLGFQLTRPQTFEGEAKTASFAVSSEEASEPAATPEAATPASATTHLREHNPELDNAKDLLKESKKSEARAMLTRLILPAPDGPIREEMRRMLDEINKELFFSNKPSPDSVVVEVQPGDTLSGIAKQQGRDVYFTQVIMLVNGISDARRIRAHQRLKIPQGTFSAVAQKHAHRLIVLLNGDYIKEYPVAFGAPESPTPEGKFEMAISKAKDPDWTDPDGHVYKFGDPKNVLGTRWMAFQETADHHGLGIHGTTDPESIGKDVSNGCIRMRNTDVEEIFGMLAPGDTVEITK
jgi:lipoprotein-anchoring transpeptidase ErfK/SrfK